MFVIGEGVCSVRGVCNRKGCKFRGVCDREGCTVQYSMCGVCAQCFLLAHTPTPLPERARACRFLEETPATVFAAWYVRERRLLSMHELLMCLWSWHRRFNT